MTRNKHGAKNFKAKFLVENKEIIFKMREKGFSYQDIANYILDKHELSISSMTISRFCRKEN